MERNVLFCDLCLRKRLERRAVNSRQVDVCKAHDRELTPVALNGTIHGTRQQKTRSHVEEIRPRIEALLRKHPMRSGDLQDAVGRDSRSTFFKAMKDLRAEHLVRVEGQRRFATYHWTGGKRKSKPKPRAASKTGTKSGARGRAKKRPSTG